MLSEPAKGVLAMCSACTIWGLSALFYRWIAHVPPLEVLCHRTIWGLIFLLVIIGFQGRLRALTAVFKSWRTVFLIGVASVMLAVNWFTFILSVQVEKLLQSSLGYFIFPLVAVFLGQVFLGERLNKAGKIAVFLAIVAVLLLTYGLKIPPYIALLLAVTFGLYGLLKKPLAIGPTLSVGAEMAILAPLALVWLWGAHFAGWQGPTGRDGGYFGFSIDGVLLMLAGPLTAFPLVLMAAGIKRLQLSTVGLVNFANPTIQFMIGILVFGELFTIWHMIAFALIWTGLAIFTWDGWRRERSIVPG